MAENNFAEEEMTVEIELEDGTKVNCAVITILTVSGKDYIALLPLDEKGENQDGEVWFYGYKEDESDPNAEPELIYIADDDEYEREADDAANHGEHGGNMVADIADGVNDVFHFN